MNALKLKIELLKDKLNKIFSTEGDDWELTKIEILGQENVWITSCELTLTKIDMTHSGFSEEGAAPPVAPLPVILTISLNDSKTLTEFDEEVLKWLKRD